MLQRDGSRDSLVGIVTGYRLDDLAVGFRVSVGQDISHRKAVKIGPSQPPIQWVTEALYPGLKRSRREADHSPPTSAEFKNTWIYTSTTHRKKKKSLLRNVTKGLGLDEFFG
jgi:hypothetical protein